jgi:hypothetical protein
MLLDPAEVGANYLEGNRMLIFAASNNKKHFTSSVFKDKPKGLRYLSPWTEEELKVGLPRMEQDINLDEALSRAKDVGMLPRYILDKVAYEGRKEHLDKAVEKLSENPVELKNVLMWPGRDRFSSTVPGTIIAVYSGVQQPNDNGQDVRLPEYVYDGPLGVVYKNRILGIMSDRVMNEIVMKSRENIL